jgi:predicted nucleic acid-binding protein
MVIVDTTVWIDYLRGAVNPEASWLVWRLQQQSLGLTDLILCEVLQGIRDPRTLAQVRNDLLQFHVFHAGGTELAIVAAQNYQILRARGHTVRKTIDCLIATFCLEAGHALLHRDCDFDVFEKELGLRVVHA